MPTAEDFRQFISEKINNCFGTYVDITSGDVHRALGGYPSRKHNMSTCCSVMYQLMAGDDAVVPPAPAKGKGATLTIRYFKHNH